MASILSKKLAEGLDALVLDVKTGSGAFMASQGDARALAQALTEVANGAGVNTVALITDMNEVLGATAGNALEVREAVDYLTGAAREHRLPRGHRLARERRARPGPARVRRRGRPRAGGRGAGERRRRGGLRRDGRRARRPADFVENPTLPSASVTRPVAPERPGYVTSVDTRAVGLVVTGLGGNRRREDDQIDYGVGLSRIAPIGAEVGPTARWRWCTRGATARPRPPRRCWRPSASAAGRRPCGPFVLLGRYEIRAAISAEPVAHRKRR